MHEGNVFAGRDPAKYTHRLLVYGVGQFGLGFRFVDRSVGGGVDKGVRIKRFCQLPQHCGLCEIRAVPANTVQGRVGGQASLKLCCDLSGFAEDGNFHAFVPRRSQATPKSGRHQSSFCRYQSTVSASP